MSNVTDFPGVRIDRGTTPKRLRTKANFGYVAVRITGEERDTLDRIAESLGICRRDAAQRMFRHGLLAWAPLDHKPDGSAA